MLKNPSQITKTVIPAGTTTAPAIRIAYSAPRQTVAALQQVLENIRGTATGNSGGTTSVLLLGRYRHLRPKNLSTLQEEHPSLSISFKTIHASKGTTRAARAVNVAALCPLPTPFHGISEVPGAHRTFHSAAFFTAQLRSSADSHFIWDEARSCSFATTAIDHEPAEARDDDRRRTPR